MSDDTHTEKRSISQWGTSYWGVFFTLAVVGVILYARALGGAFVFDDLRAIVYNEVIRPGNGLTDLIRHFPARWLTFATFAINYAIGGLDPFGYHLFNLVLHIIASSCVWCFVRVLFQTPGFSTSAARKHVPFISLLCALIFLAHPVQTQAVAYCVQRATLLAALFYLLAVNAYVRARLGSRSLFWWGCVIVSFAGGLFSKETIYTLPLCFILLELYCFNNKALLSLFQRYWQHLCVLAVIGGIYLVFVCDLYAVFKRFSISGAPHHTQFEYLLTQARVLVTYMRLMFLPLFQNADYYYPVSTTFVSFPVIFNTGLIGSMLYLAVRTFRTRRLLSFVIVWFFLVLSIESSFVPLREVIAEHRLYLALAGFSFGVSSLIACKARSEGVARMIGIVLVVFCMVVTFQRVQVWQEPIAFWGDVIEKSPQKARGYINRGMMYSHAAEYDKALADYVCAIEIDPNASAALLNIGETYRVQEKYTEALPYFDRAIVAGKGTAIEVQTYFKRGLTFLAIQKNTQAIFDLSNAIRVQADFAPAYFYRAIAYYALKRFERGNADLEKAQSLGYQLSSQEKTLVSMYLP